MFKAATLSSLKFFQFKPFQNQADKIHQRVEQAQLETLVQENGELTSLYNAALVINSSLEYDEILWRIYKESSRLVDTTNFAVILYDDQQDVLKFRLIFDQAERLNPFSVKNSEKFPLIDQVLNSSLPVLVKNLHKIKFEFGKDTLRFKQPICSWLGVPICNPMLDDERVWGLIVIWSDEPEYFTDEEQWILSAIGTQAATAIRNVELLMDQRWQAMELAVFNEVIRTLSSTLDLEKVLAHIVAQVEHILSVEMGALFLIDPDPLANELIFHIGLGDLAEPDRKLAELVQQTGQQILINKADSSSENVLCLPLKVKDRVVGVLDVRNQSEQNFNRHGVKLVTSLAPYAAIAIENATLHQKVLAEKERVSEAKKQIRQELIRNLEAGPTQMVSELATRLEFCQEALTQAPFLLLEEFVVLREQANAVACQLRTLLFELRPLVLETEGLLAALKVLLERRQESVETTRLIVEAENDREIPRFSYQIEFALFAIVQEAVTNALKHAHSKQITVTVAQTETMLRLIVEDDGKGLNVETVLAHRHHSIGIINMQERAELIGADLKLSSEPGQGTCLTVQLGTLLGSNP